MERDPQNIYRGEFDKGCRTGNGRMEDDDGNFFDGVFEKGFLIGEAYESIGDAFVITDSKYSKKVYRKNEDISDFIESFPKLIHQIAKERY